MNAEQYLERIENKRLNSTPLYSRKEMIDFAEKYAKQLTIQGVVKSLKDKEAPTLKDAFVAGYKKRALMSGLKYDEVSELNAITNFKCWKSFDLNL